MKEPGVDAGQFVNLCHRHPRSESLAEIEEALGIGDPELSAKFRVREVWQRTVARIEERRSGSAPPPPPLDEKEAQAAKLVDRLGDDSFEKREAAQAELVKLGKPAVKAVEAGTRHKDPEISTRCAGILEALKAAGAAVPPKEVLFDLDRAERFVPKAK